MSRARSGQVSLRSRVDRPARVDGRVRPHVVRPGPVGPGPDGFGHQLCADRALRRRCRAIVLSPFAGVLVDRWDRRRVMLVADLGSLVIVERRCSPCSPRVAWSVWEIYVAAAVGGALAAFRGRHGPRPRRCSCRRDTSGRAAGLGMVAQAASDVFAPLLAGVLVVTVGIVPILALDVFSFAVSVGALADRPVPRGRSLRPGGAFGRCSRSWVTAGATCGRGPSCSRSWRSSRWWRSSRASSARSSRPSCSGSRRPRASDWCSRRLGSG